MNLTPVAYFCGHKGNTYSDYLNNAGIKEEKGVTDGIWGIEIVVRTLQL
jgi:hypothetical protein